MAGYKGLPGGIDKIYYSLDVIPALDVIPVTLGRPNNNFNNFIIYTTNEPAWANLVK